MEPLKPTSFRDSISTIDQDGKRVWIHPKKPKGRFYNYRSYVSWFLLAFMISGPLVQINGQQMLLFDVINRHFVLFGLTFWPQDFYIFVLVFITGVIFIVMFTVLYGRIFCGWVCPQTIFMEMVFRKIEYLFEGDFNKQKKLDRLAPTDPERLLRRGGKHIVFLILSFSISNLFLAYIIGTDELLKIISEPVSMHYTGFISILIFTGAFYWVFSWFREQVCIIACPYGRLQGVMLDDNSMVVAYDYKRGEPREKLRKGEERTKGDCIDCKQCVHVCPTGIDIRNGTQLECINCTACVDACDEIMDKINKPRGLVGFYSEKGIKSREPFKLTKRSISYSILLIVLLGVVTSLVTLRTDIETTILKAQGMMPTENEEGEIVGLYKINIINKTLKKVPVSLKLENIEGSIEIVGNEIIVPESGLINSVIIVKIPKSQLHSISTPIEIGIYNLEKEKISTEKTNFLAPEI